MRRPLPFGVGKVGSNCPDSNLPIKYTQIGQIQLHFCHFFRLHIFALMDNRWSQITISGHVATVDHTYLDVEPRLRLVRPVGGEDGDAAPAVVVHHALVVVPEDVPAVLLHYRVTHHVDSNLPLTSKQKLHFSMKSMYRDRLKGMQILLSRTQAGAGRTGKQEQEQTSRNHVQAF